MVRPSVEEDPLPADPSAGKDALTYVSLRSRPGKTPSPPLPLPLPTSLLLLSLPLLPDPASLPEDVSLENMPMSKLVVMRTVVGAVAERGASTYPTRTPAQHQRTNAANKTRQRVHCRAAGGGLR